MLYIFGAWDTHCQAPSVAHTTQLRSEVQFSCARSPFTHLVVFSLTVSLESPVNASQAISAPIGFFASRGLLLHLNSHPLKALLWPVNTSQAFSALIVSLFQFYTPS